MHKTPKIVKDDSTTPNDNVQVQDVDLNTFLDTAFSLREDLGQEQFQQLVQGTLIDGLDSDTSFKAVSTFVPLFVQHGLMSPEQLALFQDALVAQLQQLRKEHFPDMDRRPPSVVHPDNPAVISVFPHKGDVSLKELAGLFEPGQETRFVKDFFAVDTLATMYDKRAMPHKHTNKMLIRWLAKGLSKVAPPDTIYKAVCAKSALLWVDDDRHNNVTSNIRVKL